MIKLAIYMTDFMSGGVQRMYLNLAPYFMAVGYDVSFVVHETKGALADDVPDGVKVVSLDAARARSAVLPLSRYLAAEKPDILFASLGQPNLIALLANRLAGLPSKIVVSQHSHLTNQARHMPQWQYKVLPFLYRRFFRYAHGIIAVSEGVADDLTRITGLPRERITVIYNPVVPSDLAQRAALPVSHPWFDQGRKIVVAIGRLVEVKDYPMMIDAVALVPAAHLMILGEGDLLSDLQLRAVERGVEDRVEFLGFRDNPFAYLARASALALTSRYEGFGNVIAEALACGTPVVSTDCESGPAEIVDNGKFGRLVPVGDVEAMAAGIAQTLEEQPDREKLIERGFEFSIGRSATAYIEFFDKLTRE